MEISVHKHPKTPLSQAWGFLAAIICSIIILTVIIDSGAGSDLKASHLTCLPVVAMLSFHSVFTSNIFPTIKLYQNGLKVQTFAFFWIWVPWNNMTGLEELMYHGAILVQARGLTVFHRLIALLHGTGIKPGFIISDKHNDYEALAEIVRDKWDERLEARYR